MAFWIVGVVAAVGQLSAMFMRRRNGGRSKAALAQWNCQRREELGQSMKDWRGSSRFLDPDYCLSLVMDLGMPALMMRKRCEAMQNLRSQHFKGRETTVNYTGGTCVRVVTLGLITLDSCMGTSQNIKLSRSHMERSELFLEMSLERPYMLSSTWCQDPSQKNSGDERGVENQRRLQGSSPTRIHEAGKRLDDDDRSGKRTMIECPIENEVSVRSSQQILLKRSTFTSLGHLLMACNTFCSSVIGAKQ
uniref:Uncharacterized protein n=1 Tax=Compsopogon caeruleus TaxID=31354 RepID=A0A7S1TEG5_9RHOD